MDAASSLARCPWTDLADLRPLLVGFLARFTHDDAEVDDVAQEALLRAARYRGEQDDVRNLRGWILRVGLNVLRDRARREARLPRIEIDDKVFEDIEGREEIPGEACEEACIELAGARVERVLAYGHLDAALAGLRGEERSLLWAWYSTDRGPARAGSVCESAPRMARVRAFRARRRLTRSLVRRLAGDEDIDWPRSRAVRNDCGDGAGARCAGADLAAAERDGAAPSAPRRPTCSRPCSCCPSA